MMPAPKRVLILGGGPSALTTAWHLTHDPACAGNYAITVLQMGWRLGGKGAAGRQRHDHDRIVEHGLHIMFGFYQNFFAMITEAYAELDRPAGTPLATWEEAFLPGFTLCAMDQWKEQWSPFRVALPANGAVPGEGGAVNNSKTYLGAVIGAVVEVAFGWKALNGLDGGLFGEGGTAGKVAPDPASGHSDTLVRWAMAVLEDVLRTAEDGSVAVADRNGLIVETLDRLNHLAHRFEARIADKSHSGAIAVACIDFAIALIRGVIHDGVLLGGGYAKIDVFDFADWLVSHGMDPANRGSLGVKFLYDAAFCFHGGDDAKPCLSAGVAVRTLLRIGLTYKGAAFYKMAAGMGDTIVAPLYLALKQRGVRFGFFQMVDEVIPHPNEARIERVRVRLQAAVKGDDPFGYEPLFVCNGLPSWPSTPLDEQLADPAVIVGINLESYYADYPKDVFKEYLAGRDFDEVVLATPIKCLPFIAPQLIQRSARWKTMVEHTGAAPTMALQAWFTQTVPTLGWAGPASPLLSLYVNPLNTWSDMTAVLSRESWPPELMPLSVSYFCGPQSGGDSPPPRPEGKAWIAKMDAEAKEAGRVFVRDNLTTLLPYASTPDGGFDWDVLIDPKNRSGEARFEAQYTRSNAEPQEWCTLSLPNTNQFRLAADDTDFRNLSISGDWINNGFYVACLEGAVMGGIYAARAVSGVRIPIIGELLDQAVAGEAPRPCALDDFPADKPVRVAILGSGVGSIAAAWALATAPNANRMQITVYQYGWRLGGKGASGRNQDDHDRIQEHGLHIWGGMYENAFQMIQQAYVAAGRPAGSPMSTWYDANSQACSAFWPHGAISVGDDFARTWSFWNLVLPTNEELPGDGLLVDDPAAYLQMAVELILDLLRGATLTAAPEPSATEPRSSLLARLAHVAARVAESADETIERAFELAGPAFTGRVRHALERALGKEANPGPLLDLLRFLRRTLAPLLRRASDTRDQLRWALEGIDVAITVVTGCIEDGVLEKGFDVVDDVEFTAWLAKHGASEITLNGLCVRGWHDFFFAYIDGDSGRQSLSAGTALRTMFRYMFTYKGAFFWKMQAGMGDTIFAPMYEALIKKGVRFEFFHRVSEVSCVGAGGPGDTVETITVQRQLKLAPGVKNYQPLYEVKGVPSYPAAPLWDQVDPKYAAMYREDPQRLESAWGNVEPVETIELRRGRDFDVVVLGISSKPLGTVAPTLVARSPALAAAAGMATNQTIAAQLWLDQDQVTMGWRAGSTVGTAFVDPHNTWADMTYLVAKESWGNNPPKSLVYLCGTYTDAVPMPPPSDVSFPAQNSARVFDITSTWLQGSWGIIYPEAVIPGTLGLDWNRLVGPPDVRGEARLRAQYWRGNIDPSERYVLSPPGTAKVRRRAHELGFKNLFGAGDWLYTGLNVGCVEAAAMGGLQAARAICGSPAVIVGDDNTVFGRRPSP